MGEKVLVVFVWWSVRSEHNFRLRRGEGLGIFSTSFNQQASFPDTFSCHVIEITARIR